MASERIKLTVEAVVKAPVAVVWKAFTTPDDIVRWNAASDDWHTTKATNDLMPGGRFSSTMAAKDGSASFDFAGTYTLVEEQKRIEYEIDDARKVAITFAASEDGKQTRVVETFEAEDTHPAEMQKQGWQAIMDNFKKHVEKSLS